MAEARGFPGAFLMTPEDRRKVFSGLDESARRRAVREMGLEES